MPPKNDDILKDVYIGWTTREGEVIGKVKSSSISDDGFTCTVTLNDIQKEKKMNKLEGKDICSIEIFRYGDKVIARAYEESHYSKYNVIHEAEAKCGPNDIFDFNIGAKLAIDRLFEGYDMTPKPKRKPLNGKIIVVWNEEVYDIFKVRDGKIESILYVLRCPCQQKDTIYEDSSFEEMKQALLNCASFVWYGGKSPKAICRDYETYRK